MNEERTSDSAIPSELQLMLTQFAMENASI